MRTRGDHELAAESWHGRTGLERLASSGRFAVPDQEAFRAEWRGGVVDGVEIGAWLTSPIAGIVSSPSVGGTVILLVVTEGEVQYGTAGRSGTLGTDSALILTAGDRVRFAVRRSTRILRIAVPRVFLPSSVQESLPGQVISVGASGVVSGLISLAEQVLDPEAGGAACAAARALRPLAIAALEDAVPVAVEATLRRRILEHIEHRIDDPNLSPQSIADDFGISLRWAHHVFNTEGATIARHIRTRRLELVAAWLGSDSRFPRIGVLAERSGFAGRDHLTRAFKARYGVTIAEYAVLAHEGRAPEPVDASGDEQALRA